MLNNLFFYFWTIMIMVSALYPFIPYAYMLFDESKGGEK